MPQRVEWTFSPEGGPTACRETAAALARLFFDIKEFQSPREMTATGFPKDVCPGLFRQERWRYQNRSALIRMIRGKKYSLRVLCGLRVKKSDLAAAERIESPHLLEAIQYRSLDRNVLY
jgi:hypothetical protein